MVERPIPKFRTIPGVPVAHQDLTPDFRTLEAAGLRLIAYPTSSGVVFYDRYLEHVSTLPLPASSVKSSRTEASGSDEKPWVGLSSDQEGSILFWKNRDVYVFKALRPPNCQTSSSQAGQKRDIQWKLHSEIRCQNDVYRAELVKGTILLYHEQPELTLEVWRLNSRLDFAVWERKAVLALCDELVALSLSPCESHIAYGLRRQTSVCVQAILPTGSLPGKIQRLSHPGKDCIRNVSWRGRDGPGRGNAADVTQPALYTFDVRNTIRLFTPVMDAPSHFQLVFNYRLTALDSGTAIASSGDPQAWRDAKHRPYHISSSDTSEDIFWQDRSGNVRCIQVQAFEAKPPCLLRIASEKMWTMSNSSQKAAGAPVSTSVVSMLGRDSVLVAESDATGCVTSLGQVALENAAAKVVRRAILNTGRSRQRLWRADRHARLIGIDDRGECTIWRQDAKVGLEVVKRFSTEINSETIQGPILLQANGPLLYLQGNIICCVDINTSNILWFKDLDQQLQGGTVSGIRELLPGQIMVIQESGSHILLSLDALHVIQDVRLVTAQDVLEKHLRHKSSPVEGTRRLLPSAPFCLEQDETRAQLLMVSEGRLFWLRVQDHDWVIGPKLRLGAEDLSQLTVAGDRKAACVSDNELLIWDVEDALYSNAAEHVESLVPGSYRLSWSSSSREGHLLLAVGSGKSIRILSQGRFSPDSVNTAWSTWFEFDISTLSPFPMSDFALLPGGFLVLAAGPELLMIDMAQSIFAREGPSDSSLPDFHRFHLEQCIVWDREDQVRATLANFQTALEKREFYEVVAPEAYWQTAQPEAVDQVRSHQLSVDLQGNAHKQSPYATSLSGGDQVSANGRSGIRMQSDSHGHEGVAALSTAVELSRMGWSRKEIRGIERMSAVLNMLDREGSRIDGFAKRYITALYMRASGPSRSAVPFRYVVWAMHSRRQADLLRASTEYWEHRRLNWTEAKRMGTPFWLSDIDALRGHAEQIARNEFLSSERDPIPCSLLYFALDKKATVYGLWRQAYGHKEQQAMLKFLSNDFEQERWKGAALKNAYALLSKQRYHYAAAFFMLAGQPRDAIRICLRQMDDLEMAIMLARISDYRTSHPGSGERSILELDKLDVERPVPVCGEMLREIIETSILPEAHKRGDRWLSHWGYWNLGQRGQAIRYLTLPLEQIGIEPEDSGQRIKGVLSGSADWVALYYELRKRYFEDPGSARFSGQTETAGWLTRSEEWDMVKHRCQRLWAMGFWDLSLAIVRDWKFIDHTCQAITDKASQAFSGTADGIDRRSEIEVQDDYKDSDNGPPPASKLVDAKTDVQDTPPKTKLSLFKENVVVVDSKQSQGALDFDMSSFF